MFDFKKITSSLSNAFEFICLYTKKIVQDIAQASINYFVIESNMITIDKLAETDPSGMGKIRIGPKFYPSYLVIKIPKGTPGEVEQQIKDFMTSEEKEAREVYNAFNYFFKTSIFINLNNNDGLKKRKEIVPYLHPHKLTINFDDIILNLFLLLIHNKKQPADHFTIIKHHIYNSISQIFLGMTFSTTLLDLFLQFDEKHMQHQLSSLILPECINHQLPWLKKFRNQCDTELKRCLKDHLEELRKNNPATKNWFIDTVFLKCPHIRSLSELSDSDIKKLMADKDIRVGIGVILGATNLTRAITVMLTQLYNPTNRTVLYELYFEMKKQTTMNPMDQERMPFLHALYLETLRHLTLNFVVPRYFKTAHGDIPKRSVVTLAFSEAFKRHAVDRYPHHLYEPSRFLTTEHKLTKDAKLHEGLFTLFGKGPRVCPGSQFAEVFFKNYTARFVRRITHFDTNTVIFNDPVKETKESFFKT